MHLLIFRRFDFEILMMTDEGSKFARNMKVQKFAKLKSNHPKLDSHFILHNQNLILKTKIK